jgi:hypothetical protein
MSNNNVHGSVGAFHNKNKNLKRDIFRLELGVWSTKNVSFRLTKFLAPID